MRKRTSGQNPVASRDTGSEARSTADPSERAETERARAFLVALLGAADSIRRFLGRVTEAHGLTLQQYNVLRILRGAAPDPLPTMTVAGRMLEKTPGVTRFLDHLDDRGLVRRERCADDRRRVHVRITDAGLDLLADMDTEVDAADRRLIDGLEPAAVVGAIEVLERVARNAR